MLTGSTDMVGATALSAQASESAAGERTGESGASCESASRTPWTTATAAGVTAPAEEEVAGVEWGVGEGSAALALTRTGSTREKEARVSLVLRSPPTAKRARTHPSRLWLSGFLAMDDLGGSSLVGREESHVRPRFEMVVGCGNKRARSASTSMARSERPSDSSSTRPGSFNTPQTPTAHNPRFGRPGTLRAPLACHM